MKSVLAAAVAIVVLSLLPPIAGLARRTRPDRILEPPSSTAWFGTDRLGRDLFCRTILGSARSITIATSATLATMLLGAAAGLLAARYRGRFPDKLLELAASVALATPFLLVSLAVAVLVPLSSAAIVVIVATTSWGYSFRIVRAQAVLLQRSTFVLAAISFGVSSSRIAIRYIVANIGHLLLPQGLLGAGDVIGVEAGLSFFGIGGSGSRPSLGSMIAESTSVAMLGWWTLVLPSAALAILILSAHGVAYLGTIRGQ